MKYTANEVYKNSEIAKDYEKERFHSLKGRLTNHREISLICRAIKQSKIVKPATILDMPCGTARISMILANNGFDMVGVDISPAMIELGKDKLNKARIEQRVKFKVGNGESLTFPDNFFDLSVSLRLFGHLPPNVRHNVLKELCRVSKSYVIVAYYHRNSLQQLLRKNKRNKGYPWYPVDFNQIDNELNLAGLEKTKTFFLLPFFSETLIILAKKNRLPEN